MSKKLKTMTEKDDLQHAAREKEAQVTQVRNGVDGLRGALKFQDGKLAHFRSLLKICDALEAITVPDGTTASVPFETGVDRMNRGRRYAIPDLAFHLGAIAVSVRPAAEKRIEELLDAQRTAKKELTRHEAMLVKFEAELQAALEAVA